MHSTGHAELTRDFVGEVIEGRYRLSAWLGGGTVGAVYRAEDLSGGPPLAIKIWHASVLDPQTAGRFHREQKALGTLEHPHIVAIRDYGLLEGMPYIAMELLEGESLEARLSRCGGLDPELAIAIAQPMLEALDYAHARQVVHRDLKPENVFLAVTEGDDKPHVKLLDFGLAKFLQPADDPTAGSALTKRGVLVGTPLYMAPEQALGRAIDARTDVYAAGCVLFEMLAGRPPFDAETLTDLLRAHLVDQVPRLSALRPELADADGLQAVLERALAKQASDRYADAGEMLAALRRLPPPAARAASTAEQAAPPPDAAPAPDAAKARGRVMPWLLAAAMCATLWWLLG